MGSLSTIRWLSSSASSSGSTRVDADASVSGMVVGAGLVEARLSVDTRWGPSADFALLARCGMPATLSSMLATHSQGQAGVKPYVAQLKVPFHMHHGPLST